MVGVAAVLGGVKMKGTESAAARPALAPAHLYTSLAAISWAGVLLLDDLVQEGHVVELVGFVSALVFFLLLLVLLGFTALAWSSCGRPLLL